MIIYMTQWNEINDPFRLDMSREGEDGLDDTGIAGQVIKNYLESLGFSIVLVSFKPSRYKENDKIDLFIGIGAGNPIGLSSSKKTGDSALMGVQTPFPIVWMPKY